MAFTMRQTPFLQEASGQPATNETKPRLIKPTPPNYTLEENQGRGTEMRDVTQGKPKNWVVREELAKVKELAGNNMFTGSTSTTEAYTNKQGSAIGNFFTGDGYYVKKSSGKANTTATELGPKFASNAEKKAFYANYKAVLKGGQGAQVVDGKVTAGGTHQEEVTFNKKTRAESKYKDELKAYNNQEAQDTRTNKLAERNKVKEDQATTLKSKQSQAEERRAIILAERNKVKNATPGDPVAQQSKTPFYQKGMGKDKMLLQNKNKIMSKSSPLEQEKNPSTGETLQEQVNRLAKEKLQKNIESKPLGGSEDKRTETVTATETIPGKKPTSIVKPGDPGYDKWFAAVKKNPAIEDKFKSTTNTATGSASDTGKDTEPIQETIIIPKAEPKKNVFSTSSGRTKTNGAAAKTGFGGMFNSGGKPSCGC